MHAIYALMASLLFSKISPIFNYPWIYWGFIFALAIAQWCAAGFGAFIALWHKAFVLYSCGLMFILLFHQFWFIPIFVQDI